MQVLERSAQPVWQLELSHALGLKRVLRCSDSVNAVANHRCVECEKS